MKKVLIRVDANSKMGVGHVMRSVALAQYLTRQNIEVRFLTVTESAAVCGYLKKQKFETSFLEIKNNDEDFKNILNELNQGFDWLILDHYSFDENHHKKVRDQKVQLLIISDVPPYSQYADLILNHALQDEKFHSPDQRYLFGTKYALIRQELIEAVKRERKGNQNLLVTLGGGSFPELLQKILRAVTSITNFKLNVKVLCGFSVDQKLVQIKTHHKIEYLSQSLEVGELLDWADLCISAAGGTSWELCFFGVTGIMGVVADNQVDIARNLDQQGIFKSVGLYQNASETVLAAELKKLLLNEPLIRQMRSKARKLVDGKGPERIFQAMQKTKLQTIK